MIKQETVHYTASGKSFRGFYSYDATSAKKRPVVVVAHAWRGQDDFARQKTEELAKLGYIGFAADLYGDAKEVSTNEQAQELMLPLFLDRKELRDRIVAAYNVAKSLELSDPNQVGAIGFCFGGLTVIELLRSGVDLRGVVSFHGLLGYKLGHLEAAIHPAADELKGALLILHGYEDSLVSQEDICSIQKELTAVGVDWEMDIYGHARHAFTNPIATDKSSPFLFNKKVAETSWRRMKDFFHNQFEN